MRRKQDNHKKDQERHNNLCKIIASYMKRYDKVKINQPFSIDELTGDHDVIGTNYDQGLPVEFVVYQVKGRHTTTGEDKAFYQCIKSHEALHRQYPEAKIKVLTVCQGYVKRHYITKKT